MRIKKSEIKVNCQMISMSPDTKQLNVLIGIINPPTSGLRIIVFEIFKAAALASLFTLGFILSGRFSMEIVNIF